MTCRMICLAAALAALCGGADWPQFRGFESNSVAAGKQPPVRWSESENIAWRSDLPGRGVSSPIVVDGRVVVTCSRGVNQDRMIVVCFDAGSGKQLWERQFWATGRTITHSLSANAAPTPASDGKRVFAFFSSNDLACLDLDGNLKWFRGLAYDFPAAGNDVGMSSSPVVIGNTVIVQIENQGDSFAAGIDTATGETRWRRDRERLASWSSPTVMRGKTPAEDVLLLQSAPYLTAHRPDTGEQLWIYKASCDGIPSPVAAGGNVYLPSGGITALRAAPGSGEPALLWKAPGIQPGGASPLVDGERIYAVSRAGVLLCGDLKTGAVLWKLRLEGNIWSTPALVGNRLYCFSDQGLGQVVAIDPTSGRGEVVGKSSLTEPIYGSPAVADGALYVRSDRHLWKIAEKQAP